MIKYIALVAVLVILSNEHAAIKSIISDNCKQPTMSINDIYVTIRNTEFLLEQLEYDDPDNVWVDLCSLKELDNVDHIVELSQLLYELKEMEGCYQKHEYEKEWKDDNTD